jgi:hypothetical protein
LLAEQPLSTRHATSVRSQLTSGPRNTTSSGSHPVRAVNAYTGGYLAFV